jgi:hypothetical protein
VVRQELGLDLGADAELAIEALVAAHVLLEQFVLQRHAGEIGHELEMAAVHLAPAEAAAAAEHVEAAQLAVAGHHRGGDHPGRPQ